MASQIQSVTTVNGGFVVINFQIPKNARVQHLTLYGYAHTHTWSWAIYPGSYSTYPAGTIACITAGDYVPLTAIAARFYIPNLDLYNEKLPDGKLSFWTSVNAVLNLSATLFYEVE